MFLSSFLLPDIPQLAQLIQISTDFKNEESNTRVIFKFIIIQTRATKMIKELSTIALRNPLEMSKHNEIFGGKE